MLLRSLQVTGYRRFEQPTTIVRRNRVMAVLGPNESGKSSLLSAVQEMRESQRWQVRDFTDRLAPPEDDKVVLSALYSIEAADIAAIQQALGDRRIVGRLPHVGEIYTLRRLASGGLRHEIMQTLFRDLSSRKQLTAQVEELNATGSEPLNPDADATANEALRAAVERFFAAFSHRASPSLPQTSIVALDSFAAALSSYAESAPSDESITGLIDLVAATRAEESLNQPHQVAIGTLFNRLPPVVSFDGQHRELPSFHDFEDSPRAALLNLLAAADADYGELLELGQDPNRRADLRDVEAAVNSRLERMFRAWTNRSVSVAIKVDASGIEIIGRDRDAPLLESPISQRSQGMRMFAALLAFVHSQAGDAKSSPILLIDEAEQHLHYDAQAHLVRVLGRQRVAQWVLYTTHSVGCLPEDLGTGIAVVEPIEGERSTVTQSFWTAGPALRPIMLALGATALAFTPARRVVIGEGAHEAILLPTLLRQSRAGDRDAALGFQVVGGIAEVRPRETARLDEEAGTVVYLLDNDGGGRTHAQKLPSAAAASNRILFLGDPDDDPVTIEDFVDASVLVRVTDELLTAEGRSRFRPRRRSIPAHGRAAWIQDALQHRDSRLSRTRIAQAIALLGADSSIVERARITQLQALLARIESAFPR